MGGIPRKYAMTVRFMYSLALLGDRPDPWLPVQGLVYVPFMYLTGIPNPAWRILVHVELPNSLPETTV
jgi:hypothetical protein